MKTQDIEAATQSDATLQAVAEAITKGNWHDAVKCPRVDASDFRLLERVKDELTVSASGNLILRGTRIVIPKSLQEHVVNLAHEGHQGLVKTKSLLREKVWFPNIDKLVETKVKSCGACSVATPESMSAMFVKRDESKKKSATPYDPRPRTVVEKKGSMVTAEDSDGLPIVKELFILQKCAFSRGKEGRKCHY